jgi:hypothetical protein
VVAECMLVGKQNQTDKTSWPEKYNSNTYIKFLIIEERSVPTQKEEEKKKNKNKRHKQLLQRPLVLFVYRNQGERSCGEILN